MVEECIVVSNEPLCFHGCFCLAPPWSVLWSYTQPMSLHSLAVQQRSVVGAYRGLHLCWYHKFWFCCIERIWMFPMSLTLCCRYMMDECAEKETLEMWYQFTKIKWLWCDQSCNHTPHWNSKEVHVYAWIAALPIRRSSCVNVLIYILQLVYFLNIRWISTCIWLESTSTMVCASVCVCGEPSF